MNSQFSDRFLLLAASYYSYQLEAMADNNDPIYQDYIKQFSQYEIDIIYNPYKQTDLEAIVFKTKDESEYAVIYQGSTNKTMNDWQIDNLHNALHLDVPQYRIANELVDELIASGKNVTAVSGNSLGGGHALSVGMKHSQIKAVALNPSPIEFEKGEYKNIISVINQDDPLHLLVQIDHLRYPLSFSNEYLELKKALILTLNNVLYTKKNEKLISQSFKDYQSLISCFKFDLQIQSMLKQFKTDDFYPGRIHYYQFDGSNYLNPMSIEMVHRGQIIDLDYYVHQAYSQMYPDNAKKVTISMNEELKALSSKEQSYWHLKAVAPNVTDTLVFDLDSDNLIDAAGHCIWGTNVNSIKETTMSFQLNTQYQVFNQYTKAVMAYALNDQQPYFVLDQEYIKRLNDHIFQYFKDQLGYIVSFVLNSLNADKRQITRYLTIFEQHLVILSEQFAYHDVFTLSENPHQDIKQLVSQLNEVVTDIYEQSQNLLKQQAISQMNTFKIKQEIKQSLNQFTSDFNKQLDIFRASTIPMYVATDDFVRKNLTRISNLASSKLTQQTKVWYNQVQSLFNTHKNEMSQDDTHVIIQAMMHTLDILFSSIVIFTRFKRIIQSSFLDQTLMGELLIYLNQTKSLLVNHQILWQHYLKHESFDLKEIEAVHQHLYYVNQVIDEITTLSQAS